MSKKKVILIDDERLARVELKNLLLEFPNVEVIGEAANADEGIQVIKNKTADLILLDVHMPEKTGFDMLEELPDTPPVIFITAYDEYAIKAFEFNALDYLLKPVVPERLREALERVFQKEASSAPPPVSTQSPFPSQLYLKDGTKTFFVALEDISLFSSFGNYVKVHFHDKTVLVHRSLNQIEARCQPEQFFRANRYALINLKHIQHIGQGNRAKIKVELSTGQEIEFSERKSVLFREIWGV